jgi:hypothetical protein
MIKSFGLISSHYNEALQAAMSHSQNIYKAIFDRHALWDPATIEKVLQSFPKGKIEEGDLFLILTECIANSVLHGQAEALGLHARDRGQVILLSFNQIPPLQNRVREILDMARKGIHTQPPADIPGGLGFPILVRLAHKITISNNNNKLQIWVKKAS